MSKGIREPFVDALNDADDGVFTVSSYTNIPR